jgi:transcriptional regulator with XRE-family HTH domain
MGKGEGRRPKLLGKKLRIVREQLGLSQNGMLRRLGLHEEFTQAELSAYERGVRQPPLHVLLEFSKTANVWVNVLIDDDLSLPSEIPSRQRHEGVSKAKTRK